MPFAVMQGSLEAIPSEHLRAAFEQVAALTRHAFEEEITWLLWKAKQARQGGASP